MSITLIKIIAVFAMIIDHSAILLGFEGLGVIDANLYDCMRTVGAISFPMFAFSVANGWIHTGNKKKYISNMCLFAILSQIPYTLAFHPVNLMREHYSKTISISVKTDMLIVLFFSVFMYILFKKILDFPTLQTILLVFSYILSTILLSVNNIRIISLEELNIFYVFLTSLLILYCYEYLKSNSSIYYKLFFSAVTIMYTLLTGLHASNFLLEIILVISLALFYNRKIRFFLPIIWAILTYGILFFNYRSMIAVVIASVLIFFYDENKKPNAGFKYIFYLIYPLHLLLIGLALILF